MEADPNIEPSDIEEDFPAPPPPVAHSAVPRHGGYEVRYDRYTGQPYYHGAPSSGFYLPPGPTGSNTGNQGDVNLREYQEFLTEDNTPTNEMDQYQSAPELNQLYPQLSDLHLNDRRNQNASPTDAQVREWGDTSPIAQNIRRVLSDGSFAQGQSSETNRHWNGASPQGSPGAPSSHPAHSDSVTRQMQNAQQQQADLQNMLVFPGVSAAISSKVDSLAETVKGLVTALYDVVGRVNDIEGSTRPPSVASVPDRLQPRQIPETVNPVHKQRLQQVLANAPKKQVRIDAVPRAVSITPQPAPSDSRIQYPPFPGTVRRPEISPPGFTTNARMPTVPQHGAVQMPVATHIEPIVYPSAASYIAPHTGHKYYLPPDAYEPHGPIEQRAIPWDAACAAQVMPPQQWKDASVYRPTPVSMQKSVSQGRVRDANPPAVLDYVRSEYAHIGPRETKVTVHPSGNVWPGANSRMSAPQHMPNDASENRLMEMLLFSTVSQQIKKLSGNDGLEKAKDYFREFEGLTRAWDDRQRIDLLGMKVIDSARLAFEAYEKDVSQPLFSEAKEAILDALSVEDNRKVGAWSELKNLQQMKKETVTEFGTRVKQTVRDAMGHMQSSSQLEELSKKYFIDGLRDIGIRRTLAAQQERVQYTDLIRDGALIERSCPAQIPKPPQARASVPTSHSNYSSGTYQGYGGYPGGYNGPRRYYGNAYARSNNGNQVYNQRPFAQNGQGSSSNAQQNNGNHQYNGSNQRQNWQNNNTQRQPAHNGAQQPTLTGGNAVRQAQNFQFPRSPSRQGAANTGSASR